MPATSAVQQAGQSSNAFAIDLYRRLSQEQAGNMFLSPYSIATALEMTYAGAAGETQEQIRRVLHLEDLSQAPSTTLGDIAADLAPPGRPRSYQLHLANRLWADKNLQLLAPFVKITRDNYCAEIGQLDFADDPEKARQAINAWVSKQTAGRLGDMLTGSVVNQRSQLVLTNAIYFQAAWQQPFPLSGTHPQPFHLSAEETIEVPFMSEHLSFRVAETEDAQILELPYRDGDLSMLVVLPQETVGLAALEQQLDVARVDDWIEALSQQMVSVSLPKFKLTSEFELADTLATMGMPLAFAPNQADFSGITTQTPLHLANVVHKALVDVNETGTEAAAATTMIATGEVTRTVEFKADRPFLFLIRDRVTGCILFMGRVVHPGQGAA
jgi:serpin B